jgi:hypothetical protein
MALQPDTPTARTAADIVGPAGGANPAAVVLAAASNDTALPLLLPSDAVDPDRNADAAAPAPPFVDLEAATAEAAVASALPSNKPQIRPTSTVSLTTM